MSGHGTQHTSTLPEVHNEKPRSSNSLTSIISQGSSATLAFVIVSVVSAFALSRKTINPVTAEFLPDLGYFITMTAFYCVLSPGSSSQGHGTVSLMKAISTRVFVAWTLYVILFAGTTSKLESITLILGILRAIEIWVTVLLCTTSGTLAATTIATAAISLSGVTHDCGSIAAVVYALTALATLTQAAILTSGGRRLLLLMVIPCYSLSTMVGILPGYAIPNLPVGAGVFGNTHPIEILVESSNLRFSEMLASQSKTVEDAVAEYQRRYRRLPPPAFDKWFEIAQNRSFAFIDEFDTIMHSLEPFWGLSPATVRSRLRSIEKAPDVVHFKIQNESIHTSQDHYHAEFLSKWLDFSTWKDIIPAEVDFVISTLDEPRVAVPFDSVSLAMDRASGKRPLPKHASVETVKWLTVGKQDAWESLLSSCPIDSPARKEDMQPATLSLQQPLQFVANITANRDVCASTDRLHKHGFLASPESLTITHSLVPMFGQCKPSVFNDILYPSPYYQMELETGDYKEEEDPDWDDKLDRVYWAGSATGGNSNPENWMEMHRQRLTLMTATDSTLLVNLLERTSGIWQSFQTTWSSISDMFHFKITRIVQCTDEACDLMEQRFIKGESDPASAALESKYALDMDGNTFSGRYYRLLKSKVCVLKHTIFNEWHDDRLVPWVHFVPVSAGAEEIGETMRFLTREKNGQKIGKAIAQQGRDWAQKTLRGDDMELVFVRLLMEYARILDDDREHIGFRMGR